MKFDKRAYLPPALLPEPPAETPASSKRLAAMVNEAVRELWIEPEGEGDASAGADGDTSAQQHLDDAGSDEAEALDCIGIGCRR